MLFNIGLCIIFFWICLLRQGKKNEDQQMGLHKTSFCTEKVRINKMKKSPTEWGKVYIE